MSRIGIAALVAGLVAAAGCAPSVTPESAQPAPAVLSSLSLTLRPWQNSGETGLVTFVPLNALQTQVQVQLNGMAGPHQGFLHVGRCANMGAIVAQLGTLTVGSNGMGSGTVNVPIALSTLRDGNHFIAFHQANGDPGNAVVCTDIPAI